MLDAKEVKKPELKTVAADFLSEDKLNDFLNFTEFLQENRLMPRWVAKNAWEVKISGQQILRRLRINTDEKIWTVNLHFFWKYNEYITDDDLKNFVWNNLRHNRCQHETQNCRNYSTIDILGKNFNKMCCVGQITVINPSGKALEYTKELILTAKKIIENIVAKEKIDGRFKGNIKYNLIGSMPVSGIHRGGLI